MRYAAVFLLLCTLGNINGAEPAKRLRIITTFFPAYAVASAIAGDQATVDNLLPPGVGPHDYQLTAGDLRKIKAAQIVVQNGLHLEDWLQKAFKSNPGLVSVNLSDGLEGSLIEEAHPVSHEAILDVKHHHGEANPHIWLDPKLMIRATTHVLLAFQNADPDRSAYYATNATALRQRLDILDAELRLKLAPVKDRAFVTIHNAFAYFARAYELKIVGVLEQSPDVPPPPRYLGELMKTMRKEKVAVIFAEINSPKRMAERIAADLKIKVGVLDTLESGLFEPGAYEAAMRRNADTLVRELGSPPQ